MHFEPDACYLLLSEQIVKLRDRLDESRWMARIWDHSGCQWSLAVYAIDEGVIDTVVRDPQSLGDRDFR